MLGGMLAVSHQFQTSANHNLTGKFDGVHTILSTSSRNEGWRYKTDRTQATKS